MKKINIFLIISLVLLILIFISGCNHEPEVKAELIVEWKGESIIKNGEMTTLSIMAKNVGDLPVHLKVKIEPEEGSNMKFFIGKSEVTEFNLTEEEPLRISKDKKGRQIGATSREEFVLVTGTSTTIETKMKFIISLFSKDDNLLLDSETLILTVQEKQENT